MGDYVKIPRGECAALYALEGRVQALCALVEHKKYISIDEVMLILGFEPLEDDGGEANAD